MNSEKNIGGLSRNAANDKALIFRSALSSTGIHPCDFSLIPLFFDLFQHPGNKGIRVEAVCIALATKGAFENKVFFDIQMITQLKLTVMDSVYVG